LKRAIGCSAFKVYKDDVAEIKRMFVNPEDRGKGISLKILQKNWSLGQKKRIQKLHFGNR
jgi:N-acetylglutamate synthase-like GNAT family acetyltransferase